MHLILDDEQRLQWLQLARSARIGPITFSNLINRFGSAEKALEALPEISAKAGGKPPRIFSRIEAEAELEEASQLQIRHIAFGEPDYPPLLRQIDDRPPFLLVQGQTNWENRPTVAIVGSRNTSIAGQKMATHLAKGLGEDGFVIVSGLARGIDTAAHKASLASGTLAVMAGGHKHIYPLENEILYRQIIEHGGAIVSEMPPSVEPRGRDFPKRNRIIAGLALGTVVVEAAHQSGSLITARLASEQGRLVFAIPGSPLDPRAAGTNKLIRNGAIMARDAEDIASDLRPLLSDRDHNLPKGQEPFKLESPSFFKEGEEPSASEQNSLDSIINSLSPTPVFIDDIVRFTGLSTAVVIATLSDLEIAGLIRRDQGNRISLLARD